MKKTFFALACTVVCLLTSCFGEPGVYEELPAYVIVDTTSSEISFTEFYQGTKYKGFTNLREPGQLSSLNIENAPIAFVKLRFEYDESYTVTKTVLAGAKADISSVTNITPTDSLQPVLLLSSLYDIRYSVVWVRDGYLSVCPITPSSKTGKYYLIPEKTVNDTLYFNFSASYEENKQGSAYMNLFYDLRTLKDTTQTAPELRTKMREMLTVLEDKDSVCIALKYEEIEYDFNYLGKDTVRTKYHFSNYFNCNF